MASLMENPHTGQFSSVALKSALLIDDDELDSEYGTRTLQQLGYQVRPCGGYGEGLSWLDRGSYDLVVVSDSNRLGDWRALVERAVRHSRVLVVTRRVNMHSYADAMLLGAADYLEKPATCSEVGRSLGAQLVSPKDALPESAGCA